MATGVTKKKGVAREAIAADLFAEEPFPLPGDEAVAELSYPNKVSEAELLAPLDHAFMELAAESQFTPAKELLANSLIIADNFFALKELLRPPGRRPSLIYIDPPFGTGLDFESRQQKHAYDDRWGQARYLEFMRRRLILMREILSDDGSIYLHIGHQMVSHLKVVMDEVFGKSRFRNLIVRRKCSSKNYTRNQLPNLNDYILFYTKGRSYKWTPPGVAASEEWIQKEYDKHDAKGRYKLVPIHAPGTRNGETGKEWRGMLPPAGKHWQFTPTRLDELDRTGEIHWSKNQNPRRKVYLPAGKERALTDYWDGYRDAHHQSIAVTGYPTEKNLDLMKVIVSASSEIGDLVIDPFCGSGTTLHAADDLARRWIGIDESLPAAEATVKRMRHGVERMGDYVGKATSKVVDLFGSFEPEASRLPVVSKPHGARFSIYCDSELYRRHPLELQKLAEI